eukprot:TRINITY_DN5045_c0_g1_i7.p1 TRINITY_DN5045_c0_g1~~TRINITY_DN5045_c0_g1_i7.p1  ORF type:complete len:402 (+),score=74.65 TRINITY_DN5045_c0_g1_i7:55-1260(+)
MGDAKRPGLCIESSDVYETSDLPESDQYFPFEESDTVEVLHVTTNQAFSRFKGSNVDNRNVDFSDTIRSYNRKGYIVWNGEAKEEKEETPLKKYQRLNCEIRELLEEVNKTNAKKDLENSDLSVAALSQQVETLHRCLLDLRMEDILGADAASNLADPKAALKDRLTSEIQEIKSKESTAVATRTKDAVNVEKSRDELMNYNLLMKPLNVQLQGRAHLARLVDRLHSMERSVGDNKEDLQNIYLDTGRKSLHEAVSVLSAKLTMLEPRNLDHIEGRLALLIQRMNENSSTGQTSEGEDSATATLMDKTSHLEKLVNKSNTLMQDVPGLIDRIEALHSIHAEGSSLNQSIVQLEVAQKQLLAQTSNNAHILREVEKKFQENMSKISNNFKALQTRIKDLKSA